MLTQVCQIFEKEISKEAHNFFDFVESVSDSNCEFT